MSAADGKPPEQDQPFGSPDLAVTARDEAAAMEGARDKIEGMPRGDETETTAGHGAPGLPRQIGRYHVRRMIASGGMGTVYEATQENPRRVVAVKVMKHGITSRSAVRRFEYEAQLLARLHHPAIAQIYEAGMHDDGSGPVPYFAMEYIPAAKAITAHAQEKKLGIRQRLELFAKVCDAVHHGHQKGIIHRDLKPGNVLVDAQGEVKIIDFGVARGTDSDMAVTTLQTDMGQLLGTLQYMSPEQCAADPHDIDVRSDVYALGVVLYELLSGKLPYDMRGKPAYECTRVIREELPGRLSTTDRALRGDVETIVSKALEKDRDRRYQSAVELAQDIRRYLAGEAIVARPPSIVYQLRIFARRHKALFGATAAVIGVLLIGVVVSTSLYVRAERARADAVAINEFFKDMLISVQPMVLGPERVQKPISELTAAELLQSAADRVSERFAGQPELEADVRLTLGQAFWELGLFGRAESQAHRALDLRRLALGEEHPQSLEAMTQLARELNAIGKVQEALPWAQQAYDGLCQVFDPEHPQALAAGRVLARSLQWCGRYGEAEALLRRMLVALEGMSPPSAELPQYVPVWTMAELASNIVYQGKLEKGATCARDALALAARSIGGKHATADMAKYYLGCALAEQGHLAEAEVWVGGAFADNRQQYGEHNNFTWYFAGAVRRLQALQGKTEESELALRTIVDALRRELGPQYIDTLEVTTWLVQVLMLRAEFVEAESLARETHSALRATQGKDAPLTLEALELLSMAQCGLGELEQAEQTAREVTQTAERVFTTGYYHLPQFHNNWGRCLLDLGRYGEAEAQLLKAHTGEMEMRGPQHQNTRDVITNLIRLYESWGNPDQAAEWRAKLPTTNPPSEPSELNP